MIALWVGNDLSRSDIASVESHVIDCEACQEQVEKMMASSDALSSLNADLPGNLHDSVWPGVKQQLPASLPPAESRSRFVRQMFLAGTILAASIALAILPDVPMPGWSSPSQTTSAGLKSPRVIPVDSAQSIEIPRRSLRPVYQLNDGVFLRYYYDPSWLALEKLTRPYDESSQRHVGRNAGY